MSRDLFRRFPAWMAPILFLLAALLIFIVVLAREEPARGTPRAHPAVTGDAGGVLRPGMMAPGFSGTGFDGTPLQLSSLRGHVVLVNFFASWCVECRSEFPEIQAAYAGYHARGFDVVGINALETGDGRAFYREFHATFPAILDPLGPGQGPGVVARAYGVIDSLPVSVFIDRSGRLHQYYPGRIDAANIRDELRQLGIGS
jgi:peroxiredoxin